MLESQQRWPSVLIATNPKDADSFLVQEALRQKGVRAELAHLSDFPSHATASLYVESSTPADDRWLLLNRRLGTDTPVLATVWWRRPERPVIPPDVHSDDREFVRQETTKFILGLWHHLPKGTVYVNSPAHALEADRKPYQLRIAREIGFAIPPTLFSNDPAEIRAALQKWGGRAVYKPFGSVHNFWFDSDRQKLLALFTAAIDESSLPDDRTLSLTPGIYQPILPKAFELRVTVFGSSVFSTKIFSQEQEESKMDWRNGQHTLKYEAVPTSSNLRKLCLSMLRRLRLLMGCFDFVVTPQGDLIFLEINEGGQFLWLEKLTGTPLLDAFSDFLIDTRKDFRWRRPAKPLRLQNVQAIAAENMARAAEVHVVPEPQVRIEDAPPTVPMEHSEQHAPQ
ncbi:MAG TPA: hypothetical protein VH988_07445 [Thermoanaerobaculia bacterium]|nr:hypothetical protein [Thermoanaerobaculia bacterium]